MAATESKERAMSRPDSQDREAGHDPRSETVGAGQTPPTLPGPVRPAGSGVSLFHIYKPGQGAIVRWGTAAGAGVLALAFAAFLSDQLTWFGETTRILVPVIALAALGLVIFRMVGQKRSVVEFLIATEGEMKKVNWSSRREVIGSTKVVIAVVIALGLILFFVDVIFMWFFSAINVLKIDVLKALFGGGGQ
jgi:preprotein translocase SecE subunit